MSALSDLDMFVRDLGRGRTNRVDLSDDAGAEAGLGCDPGHVSISAHGRYVAFDSDDSNLVAGDTNAAQDVFERHRR